MNLKDVLRLYNWRDVAKRISIGESSIVLCNNIGEAQIAYRQLHHMLINVLQITGEDYPNRIEFNDVNVRFIYVPEISYVRDYTYDHVYYFEGALIRWRQNQLDEVLASCSYVS